MYKRACLSTRLRGSAINSFFGTISKQLNVATMEKVVPTDTSSVILLNDGVKMPLFGLGTWRASNGGETERAVLHALKNGYRLIDTAALYG